jgi:hypothetical protein
MLNYCQAASERVHDFTANVHDRLPRAARRDRLDRRKKRVGDVSVRHTLDEHLAAPVYSCVRGLQALDDRRHRVGPHADAHRQFAAAWYRRLQNLGLESGRLGATEQSIPLLDVIQIDAVQYAVGLGSGDRGFAR